MSAGHEHGAQTVAEARGRRQRTRLFLVLFLTLAYVVAEIAGGILTGSLALLADAGHLFTDALGLTMSVVAIGFAQRPATREKTYGFYRAEILAALVNGVALAGVSAYILVEAWQRLRSPLPVDSGPMLLVACGGLIVTLAGMRLLHPDAEHSLNVRAAFLEVLGDFLGAAGTIAAALIILLTGWTVADPLMSVVIGVLILPRAWSLLASVVNVLLEATPSNIEMSAIADAIGQVQGVQSVHDLHVWTITSGFISMSGHVLARERPLEDVLHDVRIVLRDRFDIQHATLQVEATEHIDDGACCTADPRCLVVSSANPRGMASDVLSHPSA